MVAAGNSMPDNPLYAVKLATEQVRLILIPSQIGKASLCAEFADRRVTEIIYMANKGDARQVELITQRLNKRLEMLATLASALEGEETAMLLAPAPTEEAGADRGVPAPANNRAKLRMTVAHYADKHQAVLRAVLEKVPEQAKPALRRAIAVLEAGYQRTLEALD